MRAERLKKKLDQAANKWEIEKQEELVAMLREINRDADTMRKLFDLIYRNERFHEYLHTPCYRYKAL